MRPEVARRNLFEVISRDEALEYVLRTLTASDQSEASVAMKARIQACDAAYEDMCTVLDCGRCDVLQAFVEEREREGCALKALPIALAVSLTQCLGPDNFVEEFVEQKIEDNTGIAIEFTPESPEIDQHNPER